MNQNISNNWFKKLGTELNFQEKLPSAKTVGSSSSSFQSYLNQQIKSTENLNSTRFKMSGSSKDDGQSNPLKKMDTTASKLSIKAPDKKEIQSNGVDKSLSRDDSNGLKLKEVGKSNVEKATSVEHESTEETAEQTTEKPAQMDLMILGPDALNYLQALPEEVINQLPEETLKAIESLKTLISDLLTLDSDVKKEISSEDVSVYLNQLTAAEKSKFADSLEELQKLAGQSNDLEITEKNNLESIKEVLNQLSSQLGNSEVKAQKSQNQPLESVNTVQTEGTMSETDALAKIQNKGYGDAKSDSNLNKQEQNVNVTVKKDSQETKSTVNLENKTNFEQTIHEFAAKSESASISFGKQEIVNQTSKNVLHANIMDQLMNSPKLQIRQTEQGAMMTLKLNPEVLGNVEIKMEIVKGVLQAEINVENMIVKGAIESNLSDLKNALSDKGYQVESLNVSVGKDGDHQKGQQHQQQAPERESRFTADEMEQIRGSYNFDTIVNDQRIDYLG